MTERRGQRGDVVEAELDAELFEAEEIVERITAQPVVHETWGAGSLSVASGGTAPGRAAAAASGAAAAASAQPMNRRALAIAAFISRRSTTRSSMPFSSRNSER